MMCGSWSTASWGRRMSVTRHPRCWSVPVNGASPTTLPVSRTCAASKPAGTVTRSPSDSVRTGARDRCSRSVRRQPSCTTRAAVPTSASENAEMSSSRKSTNRPSRCRMPSSCSAASAEVSRKAGACGCGGASDGSSRGSSPGGAAGLGRRRRRRRSCERTPRRPGRGARRTLGAVRSCGCLAWQWICPSHPMVRTGPLHV
jgi:hypothetical protein